MQNYEKFRDSHALIVVAVSISGCFGIPKL